MRSSSSLLEALIEEARLPELRRGEEIFGPHGQSWALAVFLAL